MVTIKRSYNPDSDIKQDELVLIGEARLTCEPHMTFETFSILYQCGVEIAITPYMGSLEIY